MGQTQGVINLTFVFLISATNCRLHWTLNCNCECEQLLDWYVIRAKVFQLALLLAYVFD